MKFLAVSDNTADPRPFIEQETAQINELTRAGVLEQVYLKADFSGAVLIVEAQDQEAATAQLGTLPLVRHEVTSFRLTPLAPAVGWGGVRRCG